MKALKSKFMTSEYYEAFKEYYIKNKKTEDMLGTVTYYKPWKQWVFCAFDDLCIFSAGCLQDIFNFIAELNK